MSRADWLVETADLATGQRKRFLTYTAHSFDQLLGDIGAASVTIPVRSASLTDVWPHLTAIAINRRTGGGASVQDPVVEYYGLIEKVSPTSDGSAVLGCKSIDKYLYHRLIHGNKTYTGMQQTLLGATLVSLAATGGIPLTASYDASAITRDRTYLDADRKIILEAVQQLTEVIDGPDYELVHTLESGSYSTDMHFSDYLGDTDAKPLNVRRGVATYSLDVDGENHVTSVVGIGSDPASGYTATSVGGMYPVVFEKSVAWTDVTVAATLQQHTQGELAANLNPIAVPAVTLAGTELASLYGLGDTIELSIDHGMIQYHGLARLVGKSWSSASDGPTTVTFSFVPLNNNIGPILGAS